MTRPPLVRAVVAELEAALRDGPRLLQIVLGPRQVGKTTAALSVAERWKGPSHYAAADELGGGSTEWISHHWESARRSSGEGATLLVLDEVQKIPKWADAVKGLFDADTRARRDVRVVLLGSSALGLTRGSGESLAGRFFVHRAGHWSFAECRAAFGWSLERWLFFGGYPGAAPFVDKPDLWRRYVRDALVEPVLGRDVLGLERIAKPALLRRLFAFACRHPAQEVSYTKMLGELAEAGNATTLSSYVEALERAFLVSGLHRYSANGVRGRGATPKLVTWNPALVAALDDRSPVESAADAVWKGRVVENAAGAHLLNGLAGGDAEIGWWREGSSEVDYVVRIGRRLFGIEVKTGRARGTRGMEAFLKSYPKAVPLLVGSGGIPLDEFFATSPTTLFAAP